VEPLPPFLLTFSRTRGNPNQPAAATDCQSFVSRLASFRNSRSRDARTSWLDNDECAGDRIAKLGSDINESLTERASHSCWEPNQDNSSGLVSTRICEQTEVLVFSQKYSCFRTGQREDDFVLNARIDLCDCRDVMASVAERCDDYEVAALVGEEPHRLVPALGGPFVDEDNLFVRQRVGSVADGRLNILALQGRIAIEEIRFGSTFTQFAKDQLHGDPRSANHRLAEHYARIDFDAICECHATPLSRIHPTALARLAPVRLPCRELQDCHDVFRLEIRIVGQDFVACRAGRQKVEHILHTNAKPTNARAATQTSGVIVIRLMALMSSPQAEWPRTRPL
jgi:hypothetical protein